MRRMLMVLLLAAASGAAQTAQTTYGANSPAIQGVGNVVITDGEPETAEEKTPEPLGKEGRAEQTALVRAVRDAQVARLQSEVALLTAKLAAVERLLSGQAAEQEQAAVERYQRWEAGLAGDSGCTLSVNGEWICPVKGDRPD